MQSPVEAMRARAQSLQSLAQAAEDGIGDIKSLASEVGAEVAQHGQRKGLRKGLSSKDIFAAWDKNGNQHLSRMEFRVAARDLKLDSAKDSAAVDGLFKELDQDGDGNLNTSDNEFKAAMKQLKQNAAETEAQRTAVAADVARVRTLATQCSTTADAMEAAETAKAELSQFERLAGATIQRRVGLRLLGIGFKISDLTLKWDTNRDGKIERQEVVRALGTIGNEARGDTLARALAACLSSPHASPDHAFRCCHCPSPRRSTARSGARSRASRQPAWRRATRSWASSLTVRTWMATARLARRRRRRRFATLAGIKRSGSHRPNRIDESHRRTASTDPPNEPMLPQAMTSTDPPNEPMLPQAMIVAHLIATLVWP